jgi:hypothetical protein
MSAPEDLLAWQLDAVKIPYEREVQFAKPRKWRADFVIREPGILTPGSQWEMHYDPLLIEIDGGTWTSTSRHTTGTGFEADCVKLGEAVVLGYRVIRVTPAMVDDGRALALIERCLA